MTTKDKVHLWIDEKGVVYIYMDHNGYLCTTPRIIQYTIPLIDYKRESGWTNMPPTFANA